VVEFFLERWRGLVAAGPAGDRPAVKRGWRDVALILAERMNSPIRDVQKLTLLEAAEWMEAVRRLDDKPEPEN
jgi:hypothetical protein